MNHHTELVGEMADEVYQNASLADTPNSKSADRKVVKV